MFSFFKKKDAGIKVNDLVWITQEKKLEALVKTAQENSKILLLAWFDESFVQLKQQFSENHLSVEIIGLAPQTAQSHVQHHEVLFIEHYPLQSREIEIWEKLGLQSVTVYSALDEPLLKNFGGEKIMAIMKQLGAREDECFQHTMISSSIKNAQEKLKQKIIIDHMANSPEDWLKRNIPR